MPRGKAKKLTPKQISEAVKIRRGDIDKARAAWQKAAPARYKKLLDAKKK